MFTPWVGHEWKRADNALGGVRLMVLGESHYSDRHDVGSVVPDMTEWMARGYLSGAADPASKRFCTVVTSLLREIAKPEATRADIWRSVLFYNYVPVVLADGPRKQPPSAQQWRDAQAPFFEVVAQHQVETVLVLGDRLWRNMPPSQDPAGVFDLGGVRRWTRGYRRDGADRLVTTAHVPHPTGSYGFSAKRWTGVARHLRRCAMEDRRRVSAVA